MERIEERDGPNVRGTFTYSDGFVERTGEKLLIMKVFYDVGTVLCSERAQ